MTIVVISGIFSNTLMSPEEHSRKHHQWTGVCQRRVQVRFLPVILLYPAWNSDNDLQLAKTEISPANQSLRFCWRNGPPKKQAGFVQHLPSSDPMLDRSIWLMSAISLVIGQYKAPAATKLHSSLAVFAADFTDETYKFTSESPCKIKTEH